MRDNRAKKKILFVNESLVLAGGEKSLIALLSNIDPEKYEIDLQLLKYGCALDEFIPDYVHVLPELPYAQFLKESLFNACLKFWKKDYLKFIVARIRYSLSIRKEDLNHPEKAQRFWEFVGKVMQSSHKKYDVAIAYAQGFPTFYVMDKINANSKITWINANPSEKIFPGVNRNFQKNYYQKFSKIVAVSEDTKEHLIKLYPELKQNTTVIKDIVDYKSILKMAALKEIHFKDTAFNILTVSRLNKKMKGMDILVEVCRVLNEKGLNFHWYILGKGEFEEEMRSLIKEYQLSDQITLLGTDANPYPYYKAADLYVQTSRSESFGMSIAEARLLNLPVVTTRFDTVFKQMEDGKNGLVTDMEPESVADAVERMMTDKKLYDSIVAYLKQEPKENLESVERFDRMVEELLS